jgi:hypothetical protein
MAIVPPLDEDITTWLRSAAGQQFATHYEAMRDKIVELDGSGGGVYDDQKNILADTTSVDFTGLTGDTDGGYEIEGRLVVGNTNPTYTLQPNALATNQAGRRLLVDAAATPIALTTLVIGGGATIGTEVGFRLQFQSKSGHIRFFFCTSEWVTAAAAEVMEEIAARWTATATVITSLRILSSVANGIGAGSMLTLRKLGNPLL